MNPALLWALLLASYALGYFQPRMSPWQRWVAAIALFVVVSLVTNPVTPS